MNKKKKHSYQVKDPKWITPKVSTYIFGHCLMNLVSIEAIYALFGFNYVMFFFRLRGNH